MPCMKPLALSDKHLRDVMDTARTLPRWQRDEYLKTVAEELEGKAHGDGSVYLAARRARRTIELRHWAAQKRSSESAIDGTAGDAPTARQKYEALASADPKWFKITEDRNTG